MGPSIGVVTISFNQGEYLEAALRSVLTQKHLTDYVVVDPGSTDGSRDLLREWSAIEPKLRPVFQNDSGPAEGLNHGLSALRKTDIFAYLNADDYYLPGAFETVAAVFRENLNADVLLFSAVKLAGANSRLIHSDFFSLKRYGWGIATVLQQGTFFKRRLSLRFNENNRTCWDSELLITVAEQGARFKNVSIPVAAFRVHPSSITGSQRLRDAYRADEARLRKRCLGKEPPPILMGTLEPWRKARRVLQAVGGLR